MADGALRLQTLDEAPPRLADLPVELRARLDEIRGRAGRYVADFLPRRGGAEAVAAFAGPAHWSHHEGFYEPMIAAPAWGLLGLEGKRWRATLAILLLDAFGAGDGRFDREIALIAEFLHTASLIVDDIEDDALLRRGAPAVHRAFGLDVALNAANAMYFLPLLTIAENRHLSIAQREELYRTLIAYFVRGHLGQANDIYFSAAMSPRRLSAWTAPRTAGDIMQMYVGKTAAWPMGLTEAAAIMAQAPDAVRAAGLAFARDFGVAFQLMDDVLGMTGMPGKTKTPGEDLIAGKLTYLTHRALTSLRGRPRRRLAQILSGRLAQSDAAILAEALALVESSGAVEACRQESQDRFNAAWAQIAGVLAPSPTRTLIGALCADLLAA